MNIKLNKQMVKILAISLMVTMVFAMAPIGAGLPWQTAEAAYAADIPTADETYTVDNEWEGTLLINESKTVKISGISHDNTGTDYGAPIKIEGNATVNLVFDGVNVLTANSAKTCAGIEVEHDSTVNIYGLDDSSLTVVGGAESAGIGGRGYGIGTNPSAGNVIIHSGTITAIGGKKGAGIGSGYHSSAGEITIKGGDVTAIGAGWAAGIGSGYGASGGSQNPGVGFYNGGIITISGGKVRAACWNKSFDYFNPNEPEAMYGQDYETNCAAGIGGGYGASSGKIIIEGEADVVALGSGGGAGIGTGRGTTKPQHYDADRASCDITIRGNAKVIAMAGIDARQSHTITSGAGIGLGRGWCLVIGEPDGGPMGNISIEDNADVYAYADAGANGIGASRAVDNDRVEDAHVRSLSIGPDCKVAAVCGQLEPARDAFDEDADLNTISATALNFNQEFFETAKIGDENPFFTEDKYPAKIDVCAAGSAEPLMAFPLARHNVSMRAGFHIPQGSASNVYCRVADYRTADGGEILLAKSVSEKDWKFNVGANDVTGLLPGKYNIEYNLNGGVNAEGNPASYNVYDPAITLAAPTRSGCTFGGWYDNADLTGTNVTAIPTSSGGDKQYWAKWVETPPQAPSKAAGVLLAKMTAKGKNSMTVTWNKVSGAEGYDVFFAKCSKKKDTENAKLAGTVSAGQTLKWTKSGLKKKNAYQAHVKAFIMKDGQKQYVKSSPRVHAATGGGKYTNPKSVAVKKTKVTLKKGKTAKIKAKVKKLKAGKKLLPRYHDAKIRYISSDTSIATVSKAGKIKAKAKGTCKIYVCAVNGVKKTIKVTVK